MQKQTKEFAKKHGFKVRKIPHSTANPNGYIKVLSPEGTEKRASDWWRALEIMREMVYKK